MAKRLGAAARVTLVDCLGLKPRERAVIIADPFTVGVGDALFYAGADAGAEPFLLLMRARKASGEEPPEAVAAVMMSCDVLVLATKYSLSHTSARRDATAAGVRTASMPGITARVMARTMSADYREIAAVTTRLIERLEGAETLRLTTRVGTDITLNVKDRKFMGDTGILTEPGSFGNLPAGEACAGLALDGTAGTAVFDGSFADVGLLEEPVAIEFLDGYAVKITGGAADEIGAKLDRAGPGAYQIAEIGIGTNDRAKVTGVVLEDEKVKGTVHLALGNDVGFGGSNDVPIHLDGVMRDPTVVTDTNVTILDEGKLVL